MTPAATFVLLLLLGVNVTIGTIIGRYKGRAATGFLLSMLLGIIGVVVIACLPATFEAKVRQEAERQAVAEAARLTGQAR